MAKCCLEYTPGVYAVTYDVTLVTVLNHERDIVGVDSRDILDIEQFYSSIETNVQNQIILLTATY
eukprot:1321497-Amorphochlora_amoeboformis.AAC.1